MSKLTRFQNWEERFTNYVNEYMNKPFKRGQHDCALFVCNVVLEMTGHDFAEEYRDKYETKEQAYELLKKFGFKDLLQLAKKKGGKPYENLNFAKRGDVVLIQNEEGYSLAIIDLTGRTALTTGKDGLIKVDRGRWLKAWSI